MGATVEIVVRGNAFVDDEAVIRMDSPSSFTLLHGLEVIATCARPEPLANHAFATGAKTVRHGYDMSLVASESVRTR